MFAFQTSSNGSLCSLFLVNVELERRSGVVGCLDGVVVVALRLSRVALVEKDMLGKARVEMFDVGRDGPLVI